MKNVKTLTITITEEDGCMTTNIKADNLTAYEVIGVCEATRVDAIAGLLKGGCDPKAKKP